MSEFTELRAAYRARKADLFTAMADTGASARSVRQALLCSLDKPN